MDKTKLTKSQQSELDESADNMEKLLSGFDDPAAKKLCADIAESMRKKTRDGKMMPIEMHDGSTFYVDTTGMKNSEIEEFKHGIFEFVKGEIVKHNKSKTGKKSKSEKSKSEKSSKLKNR